MAKKTDESADVKPTYKVGDPVRNKITSQEGSVYQFEHSGIWRVIVDVGGLAKHVWAAKDVEAVVVKTEPVADKPVK